MKINKKNSQHIILNGIAWTRQSFFSFVTFFWSSEVSVEINVSSSHANTYLSIKRFLYEKLLISKYLSILHAWLHS